MNKIRAEMPMIVAEITEMVGFSMSKLSGLTLKELIEYPANRGKVQFITLELPVGIIKIN